MLERIIKHFMLKSGLSHYVSQLIPGTPIQTISNFDSLLLVEWSWDISVGLATSIELDGRKFNSCHGQENVIFSVLPRPALRPTQPRIQGGLPGLFPLA